VGFWASGGENKGQGGDIVAGIGVCDLQFPGTARIPNRKPGAEENPLIGFDWLPSTDSHT
jgi:hypothetical protein